ncbi:serine hydrolase [Paenibacillus sp. GSMTC-2017]|uniref:serine hydrolase n=1 Tax=Paenibacillus sp. GSMTC-2017 TaxID=2794350 RepID=UPI0018D873D4|nr:serine hydrolase [Paenibacillus sp. GSMTC-2017]MBH5318837.1 serine hydrolase [Paenibacillus sp. GSMTC-2017]
MKRRSRMTAMLLAVAVAVSVAFVPNESIQAAASQGPKDAAEVKKFADAFFNRPDVKKNLVGSAFVVVGDGKVLLNEGYGYADVESKSPVEPNKTMFRMASISKVFTASAVMQLVEEGKIDLDKDVHTYLSDFTIPNKTDSKLTMRHLLTHSTGFDYTDILTDSTATTTDYPLKKYLQDYKPTIIREPGSAYRYDNLASALQGLIVQEVADKPFEEVIQERIFEPLGMENSDFHMSDKVREQLATGYDGVGKPLPQYDNTPTIAPEGGMFATSTDISQYMLAHLNGGELNGKRILKEDTVKLMNKTHIGIHPEISNMGLGFEMFFPEFYNGQYVIGKGGDLPGAHSWMWLIPEHNVGGFIVSNNDSSDIRTKLFEAFMDHYFPTPDKEREVLSLTKAQLSKYEGQYSYLRMPVFHMSVEANEGFLTVKGPSNSKKLKPVGDNLFQDEDGKLAAFKTNKSGEIVHFSYIFPDAWLEKLPELPKFGDVPQNHPYADAIYSLRNSGALLEPTAQLFEPDHTVTRGEFATQLFRLTGVKNTHMPATFTDTKGHKYEAEIQTLVEIGIINGTSSNRFEPDRIISREESAVILYRFAQKIMGAPPVPAKLSAPVSPWAEEGVQFAVGLGLYGPEVIISDAGADYRAGDSLVRKEVAILLSKYAAILSGSVGL